MGIERPTPSEVTEQLLVIWRNLLNKDVLPQADFFEAGGDSLKAIRMILEVQKTFEVDLDVETFFEAPSVARLADLILVSPQGRHVA